MLGSFLPVVCRRAHVLFTLFVFVCVSWCATYCVVIFCFVFLRLVCPMLSVSLDCPFLIAPSVFSNVYLILVLVFCVVLCLVFSVCFCCSYFAFVLCLVCPLLPVSLYCPLLPVSLYSPFCVVLCSVFLCFFYCFILVFLCVSSSCVLCAHCCQFLWIYPFLISPSIISNVYLHVSVW